MRQNTRFNDSEKTRLIDDVSIGVNDNPVVGEESIECVRVIVADRSCEFVFQFQQSFLHRIFEEQSKRLTKIVPNHSAFRKRNKSACLRARLVTCAASQSHAAKSFLFHRSSTECSNVHMAF